MRGISGGLYLLALFLIGTGYLAILPPFAGFDEPAHYSSVRQIAGTGTIPVYGRSFLDQFVVDYKGPLSYGSLRPPFDRGMTYAKFFARPDLIEQYRAVYRQAAPPPYRPSKLSNWEAQHPPLYYIALAPLIAGQSSFVSGTLLLRMASFAMALGGGALGLWAVQRSAQNFAGDAVFGFLINPLVLPMFFPEFARVGNDSLCLLLAGATALLLSIWLNDDGDARVSLALGTVLGLGLLAKALFVPVVLALFCFIVLRQSRKDAAPRPAALRNIALVFAPAVLLGGVWYAYSFHVSGSLVVSADSTALAHAGGLITNLTQKFSLMALLRGLAVPPVSYLWAGSWSLARLPVLLQIPMLVLAFSCFAAFILQSGIAQSRIARGSRSGCLAPSPSAFFIT